MFRACYFLLAVFEPSQILTCPSLVTKVFVQGGVRFTMGSENTGCKKNSKSVFFHSPSMADFSSQGILHLPCTPACVAQSMPKGTAVALGVSWEELAVVNPLALGHRMGRKLFYLDNLLFPETEKSSSFYFYFSYQ